MEEHPQEELPETSAQPLSILLGKYFLHGIIFAAIDTAAIIFWAFLLVTLVFFGFVIGLIIGFILFFFFIGYVNSGITGMIWHIDVRTDWRSVFGHGLTLFIVFLIVNSPPLLLSLLYPGNSYCGGDLSGLLLP